MDWVNDGRESLTIDIPSSLSEEERVVARRFADWINENVNRAVAAYANQPEAIDGRVVNTDTARLLSRDYREDPIRWTDAVHEPASALVKEVFQRRLNSEELNRQLTADAAQNVTLMAGGPGSGKTFAAEKVGKNLYRSAHTLYDTTLSSPRSAERKIRACFEVKKKVVILYVYCSPVAAAVRAFQRALRTGRVVPLRPLIQCHLGAQRTVQVLDETYAEDDRCMIYAIDNSGSKEDVHETSLDTLGISEIPDFSRIHHLAERKVYEKQQQLDDEHAYGLQRVYEAFTGRA